MSLHGGCGGNCGCGGFTAPIVEKYCDGIQQLIDEHYQLTDTLENLIISSKEIVKKPAEEWAISIDQLLKMMRDFKVKLDQHSAREEQILFPLVEKYIGKEGPISAMEQEHAQVEQYLSLFERATSHYPVPLTEQVIQDMIAPLLYACHLLFEHFMKEENVLFPLSETYLSKEEKESLLAYHS
jgi:regulator of cell morphogenesis and NO signaling